MINDFELIPHLFFKNERLLASVQKVVKKYCRKNRSVIEAEWYGAYYKKFIDIDFLANSTLKWISDEIGFGLFVNEAYKKGDYIGEYVGEIKRYFPLRFRRNDYVGEYRVSEWVPLRFVIDSEKKGNLTRYINHSDAPNLKARTVISSDLMHVILVAIQDIPEGTQLTYDYGPTYWRRRPKPTLL